MSAFEEAGGTVEEVRLGIQRDQRGLSDLWCRITMPLDIHALGVLKANGLDLMNDRSRAGAPPCRSRVARRGGDPEALPSHQGVRMAAWRDARGTMETLPGTLSEPLLVTVRLVWTGADHGFSFDPGPPVHPHRGHAR